MRYFQDKDNQYVLIYNFALLYSHFFEVPLRNLSLQLERPW